jgi:type VI protein secretion system component VasK
VCSPSTSLLFTNVRLLPCYVNATVQQTTATASSVVSRLGGEATAVPRDTGHDESIIGTIKEAFERTVERPRIAVTDDGWSDRRLLAQIGIVLGTVYLAFLTVWFWATRLRWNPRV